jgi:hypothetical protein
MIILYTEKDMERILRDHHRPGRDPIKVGYDTQEIDTVTITDGFVRVLIKDETEEEGDEA